MQVDEGKNGLIGCVQINEDEGEEERSEEMVACFHSRALTAVMGGGGGGLGCKGSSRGPSGLNRCAIERQLFSRSLGIVGRLLHF